MSLKGSNGENYEQTGSKISPSYPREAHSSFRTI